MRLRRPRPRKRAGGPPALAGCGPRPYLGSHQSLSASTETVAWIAAAGAAGGALVGATAGGIVDYVLERLRERGDAKVGARLVRLDLSLAASQLKEAEDDGKWWVFFNTRMPGWRAHRVSLSARLSHEAFEVVTQSVAELERFGADMKQAPLDPGASFRTVERSKDAIRTMRTNATAAYNALAEFSDGDVIPDGSLLHDDCSSPDPPPTKT